jgi:putative cardiolipin synthase
MAHAFEQALRADHGDVLIVTAYLVPDQAFLESVRGHTAEGHRVQILTNSMLTTNQPLAHAFYQEARLDLLAAGAELYELRPNAFSHARHRSPGSRGRFLGLHAKSAVIGADHVLVGSMNVDPRSMVLNTEMGLLVESRELAQDVQRRLARDLFPRNAWCVRLGADGRLEWVADDEVRRKEPAPGFGSRIKSWFLGWLPVRGEV